MAVDPNIKNKAAKIRNEIYGKDVREALASGLEAMSEDVVDNKNRQDSVEDRFQDVIDGTTDKDVISAPEILDARQGHSNLGQNLLSMKQDLHQTEQSLNTQLAQKANTEYVDTLMSSITDGSPKELFYSIDALNTKYPSGTTGPMLVFDSSFSDGAHSFIWDSVEWVDTGVYQAKGIADDSVTRDMLKANFLINDYLDNVSLSTITDDGTYLVTNSTDSPIDGRIILEVKGVKHETGVLKWVIQTLWKETDPNIRYSRIVDLIVPNATTAWKALTDVVPKNVPMSSIDNGVITRSKLHNNFQVNDNLTGVSLNAATKDGTYMIENPTDSPLGASRILLHNISVKHSTGAVKWIIQTIYRESDPKVRYTRVLDLVTPTNTTEWKSITSIELDSLDGSKIVDSSIDRTKLKNDIMMKTALEAADLDTMLTEGNYFVVNPTNSPISGRVLVTVSPLRHTTGNKKWAIQWVYSETFPRRAFMRMIDVYIQNSYSTWQEIGFIDDLTTRENTTWSSKKTQTFIEEYTVNDNNIAMARSNINTNMLPVNPHYLHQQDDDALVLQIADGYDKVKILSRNRFTGFTNTYFTWLAPESVNASIARTSTPITPILVGETLTISGGFNRSSWRFKRPDGTYKVVDGQSVVVPDGTTEIVCYYLNKAPELHNVPIQIAYEKEPSAHTPNNDRELVLPPGTSIKQDYTNLLYTVDGILTKGSKYLLRKGDIVQYEGNGSCYVNVGLSTPKYQTIEQTMNGIYGVRFKVDESQTRVERIADSVGKTAGYYIADAFINGKNDFDNIYPWSNIRKCNLIINNGKKTVIYEGEEGFKNDGSVPVMVEIPKFYSKREVKNGYEHWYITGTPKGDFNIEPCFLVDGKEINYIYVGAYNSGKLDETTITSASNLEPKTETSMQEFSTMSATLGMETIDIWVWFAIQKLFLIEYADRNASNYFNGFGRLSYRPEVKVTISATQVNEVTVNSAKTDALNSFKVGQNITVDPTNKFMIDNRIVTSVIYNEDGTVTIGFDGPPVDVTADVTSVYHTGQFSGASDVVNYHTGRALEDNDRSAFKYRNIENFWGNVWEQLLGVKVKGLRYYVNRNPKTYFEPVTHSDWQELSYDTPLQKEWPAYSGPWIVQMGYDRNNPTVPLPLVKGAGNGGGSKSFYADGFYSDIDTDESGNTLELQNEYVAVAGGGWDHQDKNGPFAIRFWSSAENGASSWLYGSRLVYKG